MEDKKVNVNIEVSLPHLGRNAFEDGKEQIKMWIEAVNELKKEYSVNCTLNFKA